MHGLAISNISTLRLILLGSVLGLGACTITKCPSGECDGSIPMQNDPGSVLTGGDSMRRDEDGAEQDGSAPDMSDSSEENTREIESGVIDPAIVLEKAGDVSHDGRLIQARVISTGCTSSTDFHIEYNVEGGVCQVTIVRDKRDFCRKAPEVIQVQIPWERPMDCAGLDIVFTNPPLDELKQSLGKTLPIR